MMNSEKKITLRDIMNMPRAMRRKYAKAMGVKNIPGIDQAKIDRERNK